MLLINGEKQNDIKILESSNRENFNIRIGMQRFYPYDGEITLIFPTELGNNFHRTIAFEIYINGRKVNFYTLSELEVKIVEVVNPVVQKMI